VNLNPDAIAVFALGPFTVSATLVATWVVMALLAVGSALVTRRLSSGVSMSRWQNALEVIVEGVGKEISEVTREDAEPLLPFVGTLFLFIATANLLSIFPGWIAPTGSLSTASALALCVLVAVPAFGIERAGLAGYLRNYVRPTPLMLPFNVIGELSRTLALAVRLYGNAMSGTVIVALLVGIAPLFFPIAMRALGLLTGLVQAYIFAVLATVYIASGLAVHEERSAERD